MADTFGLGAGKYVMYGRFVALGIDASKEIYCGAGLLFEVRPTICGAWFSFGREVKNYPCGTTGILLGEGLVWMRYHYFNRKLSGSSVHQ